MATPHRVNSRPPATQPSHITTADVNQRMALWLDLVGRVLARNGIALPGESSETTDNDHPSTEHNEKTASSCH